MEELITKMSYGKVPSKVTLKPFDLVQYSALMSSELKKDVGLQEIPMIIQHTEDRIGSGGFSFVYKYPTEDRSHIVSRATFNLF